MDVEIFRAMPGNSVILLPNPPTFTIVEVTDGYELVSGRKRTNLIGKALFDVFPNSPNNPDQNSVKNLRDSLEFTIQRKESHRMPFHRYDVQNENGIFDERYWSAFNKPVIGTDSFVKYIIHSVEDVTPGVLAAKTSTELSELQQAYKKLKENEDKYRTLFDSMDQGFCILEMIFDTNNNPVDYIFLEINPVFEHLTGLKDAIGKTALQLVPTLEKRWFDLYGGVALTGNPIRFIEGSEAMGRWFDVYAFRLGSSTSKRVALLFTDITSRMLAEESIKKSEREAEEMVLEAPIGVCVLAAPSLVSQVVNEQFLQIAGKSREQIIGKNYWDSFAEAKHLYAEALQKVVDDGIPFYANEVEIKLIRHGQEEVVYVTFVYKPLKDTNGKVKKVAIWVLDNTRQVIARRKIEKSEENLRNTILQAPVAMALLRGSQFVVEIANDRMFELWGRSRETLVQKSIFDGLPEIRDQGYEEILTTVYNTGETFSARGIPVNLPRAEKIETVYIDLLYEALHDANGSISGIFAIAIDVTEQVLARHKIEEVVSLRTSELEKVNLTLVRTNENLARVNENLEEFAYAASHDMKEPIRKIQFFVDRVKMRLEGKLQDDESRDFERIDSAAKRMGSLIDDLLVYSHISRGMKFEDSVDLNQLSNTVMEDLELEIQEKNASIDVTQLPVVIGHKRQLHQLFQNLIANSLKYRKPNTMPRIEISSQTLNSSDEEWLQIHETKSASYHVIRFKDNGIGFEQLNAERIFNVFTRLHGDEHFRGTGVGLSIVKKVVENHQGEIKATSQPDQGAVFNVYLPIL